MADCCPKSLAARLKHRVSLQAVVQTSDGQGGYTDAWSTAADLWVEIKPMKAWERMQAMQAETPLTHKITMRYRTDVTSKHRILYEGRVFNIKQVINVDEANVKLELLAVEMT